ncbi:MAG TPA: heme ABC transporter permease CcmC [Xylella fastidiosa subsp. multiplex]
MNTFVHTLHRLSSPQTFDQFAARWAPRCYCTALILMIPALWQALIVLPPEHYMGDSVRIVYLHVPSAWMSLFIFGLMALYAAIALVWRIKLCEILAMACAPSGAAFTLITLLTGSLWGRSTWGTFWDWDPRLTSELILLFLYLGVIGLYHTIEDRRTAARTAGLLAIVGTALLPIIRYSVLWWNSLHQGQTLRLFGTSSMYGITTVWLMVAATQCWFLGSLLRRARAENLRWNANQHWVTAHLESPR